MHRMLTAGLRQTQALILAGGRGKRLFPLTVLRPKPAVPFGGIFRIVDFTLSNCLNSNLTQVTLLTQYRHDELQSYVQQEWSDLWSRSGTDDRTLTCLPPASGNRYRGTADAVFQNLPLIHSTELDTVLILSGDHVYQMDYREFMARHKETNADVTIATSEYPLKDASQFGVVEVDSDLRVTAFEEKPLKPRPLPSHPDRSLISMGIYAFKREVLIRALVENCAGGIGYDFGHNVIPSLIDSARVYAYSFRDEARDTARYWRDIGTIDSYYNASMDLVLPGALFNPYVSNSWKSQSGESLQRTTSISSDAYVSQSVLSSGVHIEQNASVEDSVLMPGVRVGKGARLRHAIIEEGIHIPTDFQVGWNNDQDLKHHTVSRSGVVVVSESPKMTRPIRLYSVKETT